MYSVNTLVPGKVMNIMIKEGEGITLNGTPVGHEHIIDFLERELERVENYHEQLSSILDVMYNYGS